ncbi:hypothetical protein ACWXWU_19015 [Shewanella sp. A14]
MPIIAYQHRRKLSLTIMATMLLCGGCSINNVGFGSQSHTQLSSNSKIVTYEASGLHFFTILGFGLQLGHIRQQLIYPVISDDQELCLKQILNPTPPTVTPTAKLTYANEPVMVNTQQTGLGLAMSFKHVRLNLGISSQKMLSINKQDSVSVYYLTTEKHDTDICAVNNVANNNRSTINE